MLGQARLLKAGVISMLTPDIIAAHHHSSLHRDEVLASELCGCFYCTTVFPPAEVKKWIDKSEGVGRTALCPRCGIDSVIGSKSGYSVTPEFLAAMHDHWFSPAEPNAAPDRAGD